MKMKHLKLIYTFIIMCAPLICAAQNAVNKPYVTEIFINRNDNGRISDMIRMHTNSNRNVLYCPIANNVVNIKSVW
jgi:hypothetical protein